MKNPEKETMINYRCIALFEHRFGTQNGSRFSLISSVKMQPIFKINSSVERSVLALSADHHKNPLTFQIDDVTSGSMTPFVFFKMSLACRDNFVFVKNVLTFKTCPLVRIGP